MTNCTQESFQFPVLKRRIVEANFQGGDITSDGGVLLLQQVDRRLGLSEAVARTLDDPRRQASIDHNSLSLLRQRVYALALGYEDRNDHETLRLDLAIQTALGRTEELANAYVGTLRLKLLKVGAVILRNTRRIRFLLSSACPYQRLFFHVAARLAPG